MAQTQHDVLTRPSSTIYHHHYRMTPAYSHVMELCLGFGCNISSNYAQRFAHELVRHHYHPLLSAQLSPIFVLPSSAIAELYTCVCIPLMMMNDELCYPSHSHRPPRALPPNAI